MIYEDWFHPLTAMGCMIEPCGSRVTCDPPPVDTDQDYLVVVPSDQRVVAEVVNLIHGAGFLWEGSQHYQEAAASDFMSWRKEESNLIVTASEAFAMRHRAATHVCTRLNLQDKEDRIALFQAVLYGKRYESDDVTIQQKGAA